LDTAAYQGQVRGHWQIGPLTRTYRVRPPSGKTVAHEGQDLRTGEPVGVVLLRPPWHQNACLRRDYRHGAGLLRRLDHPHVIKVHDVLDDEDLFGLVTEPLPSNNLHRHVRFGGAIPTEAEVVRVMRQIAAGLEHAHRRGVVFGNLKPTNVEVFPDGTAKIFAIPKPPHEFTSFLAAGDYLGHVASNAPEVLRCEPADERTDVYGLGLCGYEPIVSHLPAARSENLGAELLTVATAEWPAPAEVVEEIHPLLNKVVVRCLQKDPARRYPSVAEVLADLGRVQAGSTPLVSSARLQQIVTTVFPAPLAVLARALERDDHLLAQKDKLLNLVNGLVSYLGFLAAQGLGRPLGREYARPALGHWVGLVRQALQGDGPAAWPLDEVRGQRANAAELGKALNEVVRLRNRMAHAPSPEEGAVLHDWVMEMTACVRRLYKGLLFLAGYSLAVVEDLDFREDHFVVGLRRLDGLGEHPAVLPVTSAQPYTKGRVYLAAADGSRLASLHPWVVFARCPLCFQRELFFYASAEGEQAHYVTADRGHTWACEAPPELKKHLT
jgi:hypothetical protein